MASLWEVFKETFENMTQLLWYWWFWTLGTVIFVILMDRSQGFPIIKEFLGM